jgi:hypothetical protein
MDSPLLSAAFLHICSIALMSNRDLWANRGAGAIIIDGSAVTVCVYRETTAEREVTIYQGQMLFRYLCRRQGDLQGMMFSAYSQPY